MTNENYENQEEPNIYIGFGGGLFVLGKDRVHVYDPDQSAELLSFPYQGLIELYNFIKKNSAIVNKRFEAEKASYRNLRSLPINKDMINSDKGV